MNHSSLHSRLCSLCYFAGQHGFASRVSGKVLELYIPWTNTTTGAQGIDRIRVSTLRELKAAIGY